MTDYPSADFLLLAIKIYRRLVELQNTLIFNYEHGSSEYMLQSLKSEIRQLEILLE